MTQDSISILSDTSPNVRSAINSALEAIATNQSGSSEPIATYPNMFWYDTTNNILKIRNEADTGWINSIQFNQTTSVSAFVMSGLAFTAGRMFYGNGTGFSALDIGNPGEVLLTNATEDAIEWGSISAADVISHTTISGDSSVTFTGLDSTEYSHYVFELFNVIPADDLSKLYMRFSTDGGSSFILSGYHYTCQTINSSGVTSFYSTAGGAVHLTDSIGASGSESGVTATVILNRPNDSTMTCGTWYGSYEDGSFRYPKSLRGGFSYPVASGVDAVRFICTLGNFSSGEIILRGIRVNS